MKKLLTLFFLILVACDNSNRSEQKMLERCADDNVQYKKEFTETSDYYFITEKLTPEERLTKAIEYKERFKFINKKYNKLIELAKKNNGIANTENEVYLVFGRALIYSGSMYYDLLVRHIDNQKVENLSREARIRLEYAIIQKNKNLNLDQINYFKQSNYDYFENLKPPYEEQRMKTTHIATKEQLAENLKKLLRSSLKNKMNNNSYDATFSECVNFKKSQPERFNAKYQ